MPARRSVSIVIPVYNEERHIGACLEAIARQTSPVLEVIVVDNNCTDRTAAIARRYPFVRVVHEPRQGIAFARSAGFDAARGDIIGRIDADIVLPRNWAAYVQAFFAAPEHRNTVWTGGTYFYNMRFPRVVTWWYEFFIYRFNLVLMGHYTLWGSNMALWRRQWQEVRTAVHLRSDIHEDLDLAIHIYACGNRIVFDPGLRVRARLKRVRTDRGHLWEYLQWWPNTLRLHGKAGWVLAWLISATVFYGGSYIMVVVEWAARRLGRPPLPE